LVKENATMLPKWLKQLARRAFVRGTPARAAAQRARRVQLRIEILEDRQLLSGGCWITWQNVNNPSQTETRQYPSYGALHQDLASAQNNAFLTTGWAPANFDDTGCSSGGTGSGSTGSGGFGNVPGYTFENDKSWLLKLAAQLADNRNNLTPKGWANRVKWRQEVRAAKDAQALGKAMAQFAADLRPGAVSPQWASMKNAWVAQARESTTAHQVGELLQQLSDSMRP
jgi:hypothetical protein